MKNLNYKKLFFVGVGGAGMSALASIFNSSGAKVFGSDIKRTEVTDSLVNSGVKIFIGQDINEIPKDIDLVVYTNALKKFEPALLEEIKAKFKTKSYPELLGEVSLGLSTIAISGTHGKTTTTAMVGSVLSDLGLGPNIIVGGVMVREGSGFVLGQSEYLVVEADEYQRSFLNLQPQILAITNIDLDHLDYYRDISDIQGAFRELAKRVPKTGAIICDVNNPNLQPVIRGLDVTIIDYTEVGAKDLKLSLPGSHNLKNAQVALAISNFLKLDNLLAQKSLEQFAGVKRRFEYRGKDKNGALIYDDYAHNPQKVLSVISGAREFFKERKIIVVFQPHLFSRTKSLIDDFAVSFNGADLVFITPIFAAREHDDGSISNYILAERIKPNNPNVVAVSSFEKVKELLLRGTTPNDLVLFVGAGDITELATALVDTSSN